jgi:urea transport system substrate-binding protein
VKKYSTKKILTLIVFFAICLTGCEVENKGSVKVGILHSLSGTMAISEKPVVDATLMAIDEINAAGGVLGRKLEPVVVDGQSDWPTFAMGAKKLITADRVSVVFGCWTSASRKMVKPVFEQYNHLLFYPVQYEGLEQSPNIIYAGATPNQQLFPAVKWSYEQLGKRFFLAGSDYVFPQAANTLMKKQIQALGAEVAGEYYIPLGSQNVKEMIDVIRASRADVILNTINGDSNLAFFAQLHEQNIKIPVMSFSIAEDELKQLDIEKMTGHYAAWSYFQSLKTTENTKFVRKFKEKYGEHRTTNASMVAAYSSVHLWAKTVNHVGIVDPDIIRLSLKINHLSHQMARCRLAPTTIICGYHYILARYSQMDNLRLSGKRLISSLLSPFQVIVL